MATKQASTKRTSLMLGNEKDETRFVLKHFIAGKMRENCIPLTSVPVAKTRIRSLFNQQDYVSCTHFAVPNG